MSISERSAESETGVFVSRQPVLDRELRLTGYRIAYAIPEDEGLGDPAERSAVSLFNDVLGTVGLQELVGSTPAYLPMSRELLLELGMPPVPPDRVVLQIGYATAVDSQLRPALGALRGRGYFLALGNPPLRALDPELLGLFGTVEIDLDRCDEAHAAEVVGRILAGRATPLAAGLADHRDYERAKALGFQRFAGPFVATPHLKPVQKLPAGELAGLAAIARLQAKPATIEQLEEVIGRDLGLSIKLLRHINSAYFGMVSPISSIRQAVMMLGVRGVSRWALLVALTGAPGAPRELSVTALTRARMCELLGGGADQGSREALATVGLLSAADALLHRSLQTIVDELPLADDVAQALVRRAGPAGAILDAVISYERGEFDAPSLRPHRTVVARVYRQALRWAQEMLAAVD